MRQKIMEIKEHIEYWIKSAEHDWEVAESLFDNERFDWCLYIAHLVIEKILKAHYVKFNEDVPPRTHNLAIIALKTELVFTSEQLDSLDRITRFNLEARYPDEKFQFYKICTKEFAEENFKQIRDLYQWLKSTLI